DCKKWRLVVSYDGIRYAGWQFQEYPPTIQCLLEKALIRATKLDRKCLQLVGASRTDAGVHALGQVAHFLTPFNYDTLDRIHAEALNGLLPDDIRVREIAPVVPEFHARFSVTSKLYRYRIYNSPVMDPLLRHHAYHCPYNLNAAIMAEAAKHFVGRHDFLAFANTSRNDRVPHPVKTIIRFDVSEMVALLIQIGKEGVPTDMVGMILESRDRRKLAKYTSMSAPSQGLCLVSVNYNQDHLCLPELGYPSVSFGRHQTISKCKLPPYLV
ncbi:tRNA pseudouridine synthase A 1, partial [Linum perenne]